MRGSAGRVPGSEELLGRQLAARDRNEVRQWTAREDVLDVLRDAAAGRDEERVGELSLGREHEAARAVDGRGRERVLGRRAAVGLALRAGTDVVALALELRAVRHRVRPRGDGLRLQPLDRVEALGPHLGGHDAPEVLLEVHAVDDVQRAAGIDEDPQAAPVGDAVHDDAHVRRRGVEVDGRRQRERGARAARDRDRRRRGRRHRGTRHDEAVLARGLQLREECIRLRPRRKGAEEHAIEPAVRRERDLRRGLEARSRAARRASSRAPPAKTRPPGPGRSRKPPRLPAAASRGPERAPRDRRKPRPRSSRPSPPRIPSGRSSCRPGRARPREPPAPAAVTRAWPESAPAPRPARAAWAEASARAWRRRAPTAERPRQPGEGSRGPRSQNRDRIRVPSTSLRKSLPRRGTIRHIS